MTLADALAGRAPPIAIAGKSRVHRMGDDPEPEQPTDERGQPVPVITPFVAGAARDEVVTAKGDKTMPRGIYKRKPRTPAEPGSAAIEPPVKDKATRKKRAKKANGDARTPPPGAVASFVVDDAGRVSIVPAAGARLDLSTTDTKRLASFLDRTKSFRS